MPEFQRVPVRARISVRGKSMNRSAKRRSGAVLVGYVRRHGRRSKSPGARGLSSAIEHPGQIARNGHAHHRAKLGKANSLFFSVHNSGANEASVFRFAERAWRRGKPGNRRIPQAEKAPIRATRQGLLGIRCHPNRLAIGEVRSSTREKSKPKLRFGFVETKKERAK
jgi:hypothetical protein